MGSTAVLRYYSVPYHYVLRYCSTGSTLPSGYPGCCALSAAVWPEEPPPRPPIGPHWLGEGLKLLQRKISALARRFGRRGTVGMTMRHGWPRDAVLGAAGRSCHCGWGFSRDVPILRLLLFFGDAAYGVHSGLLRGCWSRASHHQYPPLKAPITSLSHPRYLRCLGRGNTKTPTTHLARTYHSHSLLAQPAPQAPPRLCLALRWSSSRPLAAAGPLKDSSSHSPSFLANGCEAERPAAGRTCQREKKRILKAFPFRPSPSCFH